MERSGVLPSNDNIIKDETRHFGQRQQEEVQIFISRQICDVDDETVVNEITGEPRKKKSVFSLRHLLVHVIVRK